MIDRILDLIKQRGITEYRVAKDLGFSFSTFSLWKSGKNSPSTEALVKMAKYFGVSVDYLLGLEEIENDPVFGQLSQQEIALIRAFRRASGLNRLSTLINLANALLDSKDKDDKEIVDLLLQGANENLVASDVLKFINQHGLKFTANLSQEKLKELKQTVYQDDDDPDTDDQQ